MLTYEDVRDVVGSRNRVVMTEDRGCEVVLKVRDASGVLRDVEIERFGPDSRTGLRTVVLSLAR